MDPQNADVLFLYGRSLFEVGKSKSDVLGGKATEKKKPKTKLKKELVKEETTEGDSKNELEKVIEETAEAVEENETKKEDGAPLFKFTGDENFDDSEEEEEEVSCCLALCFDMWPLHSCANTPLDRRSRKKKMILQLRMKFLTLLACYSPKD